MNLIYHPVVHLSLLTSPRVSGSSFTNMHNQTHWETLTVGPCSGLKPLVGLSGWSIATENPRPLRPLLPSAEAGMDTSVTV